MPELTGRRPLVGIAVEGVTTYGRSILRGVVKYANLQRKWVLHEDIWRTINDATRWPKCDGTIIAGVPQAIYQNVIRQSRHVVSCSSSYDPEAVPTVALDDEATAALAAKHLIDCCLKHFACYGPVLPQDINAADVQKDAFFRRAIAFARTLAERGFTCTSTDRPLPSYRELLTHAHHPRLIRWLQELPKPVGIFAVDDMMARDLAAACRAAEIGVPERVAIVGVNNDDLLCESAWPPLSSVEADFTRMGYLAAKTLDRLFAGEALRPEERLIRLPPVRVQQRMSTDLLATDHQELADAIRFIREHACDPCSVDDVMSVVPLARRTLERLFVEILGRTPYEEIARVRLEAACRLLVQRDLTIADVAARCGFSAIQSFNRFVLQRLKVTPAAYRRQLLGGVKPRSSRSSR